MLCACRGAAVDRCQALPPTVISEQTIVRAGADEAGDDLGLGQQTGGHELAETEGADVELLIARAVWRRRHDLGFALERRLAVAATTRGWAIDEGTADRGNGAGAALGSILVTQR